MRGKQTLEGYDWHGLYTAHIHKAKIRGEQLTGLCPFHEDHHPSFSANLQSGLFRCHACGETGNGVQFYSRIQNIGEKEAFRELRKALPGTRYEDTVSSYPDTREAASPKTTRYDYTDEQGTTLYSSVRVDYTDERGRPAKRYYYEHLTVDGRLLKKKPEVRVPYQLARLTKEESGLLFVVEGEKCAEALLARGCLATTTGGASSYSEWTDEYARYVAGFDVVVLPDNDEPGRRYGFEISKRMHGQTRSLKCVNLCDIAKDLPAKGDIVDYFEMGYSLEALLSFCRQAAPFSLRENGEDPLLRYDLNDRGNAARYAALYGDRVRYNPETAKWYCWDGARWKPDDTGQVWRYALEASDRFLSAAKESSEYAVRRFALQSGNVVRLKGMLEIAEKQLYVTQDMLDTHPGLLSLPAATVTLREHSAAAHQKEHYITKMLAVDEVPGGCPTFMRFLQDIFTKKEIIPYLQRVFGYCLTGETSEQVFFIAYGTGSNGKSTLIDLVGYILGEYVESVPVDVLMSKESGSSATPELARARGARLVVASESSELSRINEGQIKQLTGNDVITARPLYSQGFTYKPEFKIWISTNHKPTINGSDYGIWRRVHLIPFEVTIEEEKRDKALPDKLKAEAPAILHWMLEGAKQWYAQGLCPPDAILDAVREYRSEMDLLEDFLSNYTLRDPEGLITHKRLYECYAAYSRQNGLEPMSGNLFGRKMTERGFRKQKMPMLTYPGLSLNAEGEALLAPEEPFLTPFDLLPSGA